MVSHFNGEQGEKAGKSRDRRPVSGLSLLIYISLISLLPCHFPLIPPHCLHGHGFFCCGVIHIFGFVLPRLSRSVLFFFLQFLQFPLIPDVFVLFLLPAYSVHRLQHGVWWFVGGLFKAMARLAIYSTLLNLLRTFLKCLVL
ncbi:hypothetical protein BDV09DRAFT_1941 [Aspergillus tetrazonus]